LEPHFTFELDRGQTRDFSAGIVVEGVQRFDREAPGRYNPDEVKARTVVDEYRARLIRRWNPDTPYTTVVDNVAEMMRAPELAGPLLVVDRTGVGSGVADVFGHYHRGGRMGGRVAALCDSHGGLSASRRCRGRSPVVPAHNGAEGGRGTAAPDALGAGTHPSAAGPAPGATCSPKSCEPSSSSRTPAPARPMRGAPLVGP